MNRKMTPAIGGGDAVGPEHGRSGTRRGPRTFWVARKAATNRPAPTPIDGDAEREHKGLLTTDQ